MAKTAKKAAASPAVLTPPEPKPAPTPTPEVQGASTKLHKAWTGTLTFGLVSMPVALYTGASGETVSFNTLHAKCGTKVKQGDYRCVECGDIPVAKTDTVKGYPINGGFVTVTPEEIESAKPDSSKTLEILEFIPAAALDPIYFESSYYLAPSDGGMKQFALVRAAMANRNAVAIAKVVKSSREHLVAIRPYGDRGLMVHTMYFADEVRPMVFPQLWPVKPEELVFAEKMVDALTYGERFDAAQYKDEYRAQLMNLIQAKAQGVQFLPSTPKAAAPVAVDVMGALQASLEMFKTKKKVARAS